MKKLYNAIKRATLNALLPGRFYFSHKGYCPCCNREVFFQSTNSWLRDFFLCSNCFSLPRERALMLVIDKYYPEWRNLDIHESSPSGGKASLKLRKNAKKYMASQYYPGERSGAQITYYQNQDLENQTFKDESFDLVITQDVMEHVFNPAKAFSEIARTLKKGGAHVFTVPLVNKHRASEVWAVKGENNQPVFLKTPEWHGNPINAKGSPVTMHWGYDIAGFIKENSGLETIIEYIDNLDYGIRAEFNEVVISRKQCSM